MAELANASARFTATVVLPTPALAAGHRDEIFYRGRLAFWHLLRAGGI